MSLLAKWTWSRPLRAIEEALAAAGVDPAVGPLVVVDAPQAAQLLALRRPLVALGPQVRARAARRVGGRALRATGTELPLADGALAALVGTGADATALAAWTRAVRDGGLLVLVDRVAPEEHTRRAICAGLVDIEQRTAGRHVITSGRIRRFA